MVENIVCVCGGGGKGEEKEKNAGYQHFLLFAHCLKKNPGFFTFSLLVTKQ